jgi:hypothetical protein
MAGMISARLGEAAHPPEEAIRQAVAKVYARPEFEPSKGWDGWLLLLRAIEQLFKWLGGLGETNRVLFWILLWTCVALLLLLVAHLSWSVIKVFTFRDRAAKATEAALARQGLSRSFWEKAQSQAAAGDFTEALRCLFLSLVYRFDENGRVHFDRAYTNREYLSLVADRPEIQSKLARLVDALDEYWYGQRPVQEPLYRDCLAVYQTLT